MPVRKARKPGNRKIGARKIAMAPARKPQSASARRAGKK